MKTAALVPVLAIAFGAIEPACAVTVTSGTVNGFAADIWAWTDSHGQPRTVALKREGAGNSGHGGYAIQMTYFTTSAGGQPAQIVVNAGSGGDGGFGYFVSHERYRYFSDKKYDTIASRIFHKDDSPLGRGFKATMAKPATPTGVGAERFTINYGHYGTIAPDPVDPNSGDDSTPLPLTASNYAFYTMPVMTTWVFQDGVDYPRIDVRVDLSKIVPPGGATPTADLVSFDVRGPYGVMVFDNGADGTVKSVLWGDQEYLFVPTKLPVTRNSGWQWNVKNNGARYQSLLTDGYEMGLYEPRPATTSPLVDGYASERGFTGTSYAADGGKSYSSCGGRQRLPSDGTWPYQSVQYSLPCSSAGDFKTPTDGKKIAWGSTAYFGTSLTDVYNGQKSIPFKGFPANYKIAYSVCVVLGQTTSGVLTKTAAAAYAGANPVSQCATQAVP
jgi:hypothetical protein